MNITFVLPPISLSGGIRVVAIYAEWLIRAGHGVSIVSPPRPEAPLRRKVRTALITGRWPRVMPPASHLDVLGVPHRVLEVARPVVNSDVPDGDVVVATWWETAEWVAGFSQSKGAKAYFIQHHEVFDYLPLERVRATYRLPMHKIVIAQWLKDVMAREYGDDDVDLVPNSVDVAQFFAAPRGRQQVPTVGLLYANQYFKGLEVSLAAIEKVRARVPSLRVIAFGSERPPGRVPLPEYVELSYMPRQEQLRELYAQCDVWITASRSEGFNLPAMEAMACRTPVVSTRTGWPAESIATGQNGVLVDIDDVNALAEGVQWILSRSDEEWRKISQSAYGTATAGSWEQSAALFDKALCRAVERSKNGELSGGTIARVS